MALSGLQIFKLLPKTNCKECGLPTCLAFAMKLANKAASVEDCPDASDELKTTLGAASEPPMRTVKVGPDPSPIDLGGETVCYRHEKTFVNQTAVGISLRDDLPLEQLAAEAQRMADYEVERVGERLAVDLICLQAVGGDFVAATRALRDSWNGAVVLSCSDPAVVRTAAVELKGRRPALMGATQQTLDAFIETAKGTKSALVLSAATAEDLSGMASHAVDTGLRDLFLHVNSGSLRHRLEQQTIIRRCALHKGVKALGYPLLMCVDEGEDAAASTLIGICKYASVVLLPTFDEATLYPLLTLRQAIYTDPQKPIQVEPGIYPIGSPGVDDPVFLTTNFSLTYFMVSGEIENSGMSAHLVVHDSEGMSVLTAWAAGKFTGQKVAEFIKTSDLPGREAGRRIVIPGYAAMISGDLEENLPGFEVLVGPQEAVDIATYVKQAL